MDISQERSDNYYDDEDDEDELLDEDGLAPAASALVSKDDFRQRTIGPLLSAASARVQNKMDDKAIFYLKKKLYFKERKSHTKPKKIVNLCEHEVLTPAKRFCVKIIGLHQIWFGFVT